MKNQTTSSSLTRIKKSLAGLFALMALSIQLVAQQANCNAHFYHYGFNSLNVNFYTSNNWQGTTYAWNFGDGDTSTQRNPVHAYATAGPYYVCLTVTRLNAAGAVLCTATVCDSIHVTLPPPPPPPVCNAHFTHHGFWNSGAIDFDAAHNPSGSTYLWDFGDTHTATVKDTDYTYAQAGTYYVCLTVTKTDSAGTILCTDHWCDSVYVATVPPPPPAVCNAHFTHGVRHSGAVDFDAAHNGPGATYSWSFGDGHTATVKDTDYFYALPGTYYACLTVTRTDTSGTVLCTSTWCDSVHIAPPPAPSCHAHFYHHRGPGLTTYFYGTHNSPGATYTWDFGDTTTSSSATPTHVYAQPGTYYACLTVTRTDTAGTVLCTDTYCDSIHIIPPPPPCHPRFWAYTHHQLDVNFVSSHNPNTVTYSWDFGDGSPVSTAQNPIHIYPQPAVYTVCLTVTNTDTNGIVICTATWCDSVRVDTLFNHCWNHNGHHGCNNASDNDRVSNGSDIDQQGTASASVFPNPMTENAVLRIENMTGNVTFKVFESSGRLVSSKENLGNGDFDLNKKDLGAGLYFYQVSDSNGNVLTGKLIVQ